MPDCTISIAIGILFPHSFSYSVRNNLFVLVCLKTQSLTHFVNATAVTCILSGFTKTASVC